VSPCPPVDWGMVTPSLFDRELGAVTGEIKAPAQNTAAGAFVRLQPGETQTFGVMPVTCAA
jgi:hypothetical protein